VGNAPIPRLHCQLLVACLAVVFVVAGCGSDEERLDDFMTRGNEYVENEDFEEAIIEYKNVLQIDPNHAPAHEALGGVYLHVKKPREAYWEMSETVRLDPDNIPARLRYGTVSSAIGEHDLALEQAEAVLALEPDRAQAFLLRAQAREGLEDYEGTEADLRAAIASRPQGAAYRFLLAGFLERRDRKEESIEVLRELIEIEPSYLAYSNLGRLIASQGDDPEEAEALFRKSVAVAKEAPAEVPERDVEQGDDIETLRGSIPYNDAVTGAYMMLAAFLFENDRFDESIATLEEGAAATEGETQLIYQMARLYTARGMKDEADALIVRATKEQPNKAAPQLILSAYLGQQGDLEGALKAAEAAVAAEPKNTTAKLREAEIRVDIGYRDEQPDSFERGRKIVDSVLATAPSNPEAYFVLAKIELAENNMAAAEQALLTALETRPDWPQARFVLGSALVVSGDLARARGELARAVELDPAMADARKMLTQVHAELGEHEFAIEQGRAYLRQVPKDSAIRIVVGQSLIRLGRAEEAYAEVSKIPEDERDAAAYYALGRLEVAFGRKEKGRELLLEAYELDPRRAAVLRMLLALDRESGDIDASAERIRIAAENAPEDSELAELVGEVALLDGDEGDREAARAAMLRAVELDPRNLSAQLTLADIERRAGNTEAMLAVMEAAALAVPESSDLQFRLGLLYEQRGEQDKSIQAYERAIALDNNLAEAKNNLAYLLTEVPKGDLDRALELAQQAKEQRPDDPNAADTLGWVLLKRGVPSAAIGYLKESYDRFPKEAAEFRGIVGNHLAEAYEKNKESAKAIATSEEVVASYKAYSAARKEAGQAVEEPEWARDARVRIERLSTDG
jgi:tetratricopeptide (TPR) repeat protein